MIEPAIAALVAGARAQFQSYTGEKCRVAFAPGRVNLIGEHTDYNDGFVLPMALQLGVAVAYRATGDGTLRVRAVDVAGDERVSLSALDQYATTQGAGRGWFAYVAGVARALRDAGLPISGAQLVIQGTVPRGAGLSSSAALEVACARALVDLVGGEWDAAAMAQLCQRVENDFVGVPCGIMDQMASACSVEGGALLLDCRSLERRPVPLPVDVSIIVMDSGVRRRLETSAYAARRADCARAAAQLQQVQPMIRSLRDVTRAQLDAAGGALDGIALRRATHVVDENDRVLAFVKALQDGNGSSAGALLDASHESLRTLFEVSSGALDSLVDRARRHPGCLGARMTGAGFGGCAVALVRKADAEDFAASMTAAAGPGSTPAFIARPCGGATIDRP